VTLNFSSLHTIKTRKRSQLQYYPPDRIRGECMIRVIIIAGMIMELNLNGFREVVKKKSRRGGWANAPSAYASIHTENICTIHMWFAPEIWMIRCLHELEISKSTLIYANNVPLHIYHTVLRCWFESFYFF
jgi:hypothetical protein